jgi:hypothetical protein
VCAASVVVLAQSQQCSGHKLLHSRSGFTLDPHLVFEALAASSDLQSVLPTVAAAL